MPFPLTFRIACILLERDNYYEQTQINYPWPVEKSIQFRCLNALHIRHINMLIILEILATSTEIIVSPPFR